MNFGPGFEHIWAKVLQKRAVYYLGISEDWKQKLDEILSVGSCVGQSKSENGSNPHRDVSVGHVVGQQGKGGIAIYTKTKMYTVTIQNPDNGIPNIRHLGHFSHE